MVWDGRLLKMGRPSFQKRSAAGLFFSFYCSIKKYVFSFAEISRNVQEKRKDFQDRTSPGGRQEVDAEDVWYCATWIDLTAKGLITVAA